MKLLSSYKLTRACVLILFFLQLQIWSQRSLNVASGSYAEYPPSHEHIGNDPMQPTFQNFATNPTLDIGPEMAGKPIPTNDWWTSVLYQENGDGTRNGGNLWTYPLLSRATTDGYQIGHRTAKDWGGEESVGISVDYLITLGGADFASKRTVATNWSDWHVDLEVQDSESSKTIAVTLAQGMPFVWAKTNGFNAVITAIHTGVRTYYDTNGDVMSFPTTTDRFAIEYDGNLYGVHLPQSRLISSLAGNEAYLEVANSDGEYVVFSALTEIADLDFMHDYAFAMPTDTKAVYDYQPENGVVNVRYSVAKTNIIGNQSEVLQGFIPHHYTGNANSFSFLPGREYRATARGTLKLAAGTRFDFRYPFNADVLPHFNAPITNRADANPYDEAKLVNMIDTYSQALASGDFADGTYWGGKALVKLIKYVLIAKEIDHPDLLDLLALAKERTYDWLTYTPGETSFYYAYYPAWKALVGFNEEYYSGFFTDHHFHYGYLAHAGALLEMAEPGAMEGYWEMLTKIIKTYANWDRDDEDFPYMRTFSPWMGHSFANGLGNAIGNNQESTSEAMQSWAGMFMTAEMTENEEMRDAAAYGYLMESRAIASYWYNDSGVFEEIGYDQPIVGILEMNRYVYGTFFGAQDTYIHGIQWLPVSPAYGFWNDFLTTNEANALVDPIINNMASDLGALSGDWMNVSWGFKLFFDPEGVTKSFEEYWNSTVNTATYAVAHHSTENALTYYYAHNSQNLGLRQSNYRLSLPLSSAFEKNGTMSYVVYNPKDSAQTCSVYKDGSMIDSFTVPPNTLMTTGRLSDDPSPSTTLAIPGVIQAEEYKEGGQGVGYTDTSPGNRGGQYRTDDVDIQYATDSSGTYNVGWISAGEWLAYDIDATSSSNVYSIDFRVASPNGNGSFHLELDGSLITDVIAVPNTGNWQNYTTITVGGIAINPGPHELKMIFDTAGLNLNYFEFRANTSSENTCTGLAANGQYRYEMSVDRTNPTLTFIPQISGIGDEVCILYYGTDAAGIYPGYQVQPNMPYTISASAGASIYFYYTYSLPTGGENNTAGSRHRLEVGACNGSKTSTNLFDIPLTVSPNPAGNSLTIFGVQTATQVALYTITGALIEEVFVRDAKDPVVLDISELTQGVYLIRFFENTGNPKVIRVLKE